jgi:uncharacterized integral membrane protein
VILLLSNRDFVPVNFWPFGGMALPLGGVLLGALGFGFLAGLIFHLPHRFRANRRAKRAEKRVAELEAQLPPTQDTP